MSPTFTSIGIRSPFSNRPGPDGDDLALGRLLLGGVGDVQPAAHRLGLFARQDDDAILERVDLELGLALGGGAHELLLPHSVAGDGYKVRPDIGLALGCLDCLVPAQR